MRPKKYNTPEEKRAAMNKICRDWYKKHKNDPEYQKLTLYRYEKYNKGLNVSKEDFMKSYNTDYVFYIRMVRTGKFQKKIEKAEENYKILTENIKMMKKRLEYLLKKFGHLESETVEEVKENDTNANKN